MNIRFSDALFAVLVHGLLFGFLIVGVQCSHTTPPPGAIQGVIISSQPPKTAEKPQTPPQPVVPKADRSVVSQEETHQNAAEEASKQKQEAEAAQRALVEQQRAQEKAQQEAIIQQKAKADAEAKAKAQEEAKQAAEQAAAKKQAEEEKRKQALAAQKKADADRKAKAAAAAKAAADKRWAQEQLAGNLASELQGEAQNQWISQLTAAISRAWSYIAGADQLHCKIKIQLSSGGEVLSAKVTQSSGNKLFDDSGVTAAYKASPLPLPSDPSAFDPNITICFSPGGTSC